MATILKAHRVDPDAATRADDTLAHPDYVDCFAVATTAGRTPEQWAKAILEGAPTPVQLFVYYGWRFGIGLILRPRHTPGNVLGWPTVHSSADHVVLAARSVVLGQAHLLVKVEPERVTLSTFIRFERPWAKAVWAAVGLLHRQINPYLLTRAARSSQPAV